MLSKRYELTEIDSRTLLHVPSGPHWSTSSEIINSDFRYRWTSCINVQTWTTPEIRCSGVSEL